MATQRITVFPGASLYAIAARIYGSAGGWTIIARANGLTDPVIQEQAQIAIPPYNAAAASDGILSPV